MIPRLWDIQFGASWWLSLGFHFDHTDPSLTFHLPGVIVCVGRCKQPGFECSMRRGWWKKEQRICRYDSANRTEIQ